MESKGVLKFKMTPMDDYGFRKFIVSEDWSFPDNPKAMSGGCQIAIFHLKADADEYIEFKTKQLNGK